MNAKSKDSMANWVDPDEAPELDSSAFKKAKKMIGEREVSSSEFREAVKRGRPPKDVLKLPVSIRLSPQVVEYFKRDGKGWQTRLDQVLSEYVEVHSDH